MRIPAGLAVFEIVVSDTRLALFSYETAERVGLPPLTAAERAVMSAVLRGRSNAEIAAERRTAQRTVANQVASLFQKLGVRSRAELVARYGVER